MSIDIQIGSNPLNVPQLNTGGIANMLDTTLLGLEIGNKSGNIQTNTAALKQTLTGATAGSVVAYQPQSATGMLNTTLLVVNGYENDTTTAQSITYSIPYVTVLPSIAVNTSGLTVTSTGTVLTITAPDAVTIYNGIIEIIGVL